MSRWRTEPDCSTRIPYIIYIAPLRTIADRARQTARARSSRDTQLAFSSVGNSYVHCSSIKHFHTQNQPWNQLLNFSQRVIIYNEGQQTTPKPTFTKSHSILRSRACRPPARYPLPAFSQVRCTCKPACTSVSARALRPHRESLASEAYMYWSGSVDLSTDLPNCTQTTQSNGRN